MYYSNPRWPALSRPDIQHIPPLSPIQVEHLCSLEMLHRFIADFDDFVYPLFPLVHRPTCHSLLENGTYNTDPAFLRWCFSLSALTVASVPNKESEYCAGRYPSARSLVDRACDLVLLSRVATEPAWQDNPTPGMLVESTLLSMACHYTGRQRRGWSFGNEACVALRDLRLHTAEGLLKLSAIDAELCKRAFWVLHMTQMLVAVV